MPQSVARVALHLVYSTKNRVPLLKSGEIRQQLYAYIATILKEQVDSPAIITVSYTHLRAHETDS